MLRKAPVTVLTALVLLGFAPPLATVASATACSNSWINAAGGDYGVPANWSGGVVPAVGDDACITLAGTYIVTLGFGAATHSMSIGGSSGSQTLIIASVLANTGLSATNGLRIGVHGGITLDGTTGGVNVDVRSSLLTNAGTITSQGSVNDPMLLGDLNNSGTINVNRNLRYRPSVGTNTLTNSGTIAIANNMTLTVETSPAIFNNNAGGTINAAGTGHLDVNGGTYNQGAGTMTGASPVAVVGALKYTGTGAGHIFMYGGTALSGTSVPGQTLLISNVIANTGATAAGGFTNGGTIILDGTNGGIFIDMRASTLTNTGAITSQGSVNNPMLMGDLNNSGTINVNFSLRYRPSIGTNILTNTGTIAIANNMALTAETNSALVNNNAGGTINAAGTGHLDVNGGIYNQGAGTTVGLWPVMVVGALVYTGTGASRVAIYGGTTLGGTSVAGQTLMISASLANTGATAAGGFTNGGTIILDGTNGGIFIDMRASTLTNTGTITSQGSTNNPMLMGDLNNSGTINVNFSLRYRPSIGTNILTNTGTIAIANNMTFSAETGSTAVNQNAGSTTIGGGATLTIGSANPFALTGGTLNGSGTIVGDVVNSGGHTAPTVSPATLHITGNYTQSAGGTLDVGVNSVAVGQFDVLAVTGNVTLNGKLALKPTNAYAAAALLGESVAFITYGGTRSGSFSSAAVTPALSGGKPYGPRYDDLNKAVKAVVGVSPPVLFHAVAPARVQDSRPASQVGPYSTPWTAGTSRDITVGGAGGVPADADAVVLNVTVGNTTAASYLTIWPQGSTQPLASNLNWVPGQVIANQVTVKLGVGGKISVFNPGGAVDVVIDVNGYYDSTAGDGFTPLAPVRVQDSRPGSQVGPYATPWNAGTIRDVAVGGANGVPADADAVVLNVTAGNTTTASYLTIWPKDAAPPLASNLNWAAGVTIPNAVTVKLGSSGKISIFNSAGGVDVVVDVAGYFKSGTGKSFHALAPTRVQDSRPATQVGPYSTPWTAGTTRDVTIKSPGGVPVTADAVVSNVTVGNTTAPSYLTIWPQGAIQPLASNLNWVAGQTIPNAVTVKLGAITQVSIFNPTGAVDVVIDVGGYYGI